MNFIAKKYADLTEIVCEANAPLCPSEKHVIAVISHSLGGKWAVFTHRLGERRVFATRKAAEAYVLEAAQ